MGRKILLATNCEFGQANVFLAVGHALQALDSSLEIHFVSFPPLAPAVSAASKYAATCFPGAQPWAFHELEGTTYYDALMAIEPDHEGISSAIDKPPSFFTSLAVSRLLNTFVVPWSGNQFMQIFRSFTQIVEKLQPDLVVVDCLSPPMLTACRYHKIKHVILSPNTIKDFSTPIQPWGAMFWKYPSVGSGLPYPLPWRHLPANILYCLCHIWYSVTDPGLRAVVAHIKRELPGVELVMLPTLMMSPPPDNTKILIANRPEIEFPLVVPKHLTPCGPMMRPIRPVSEVDPELDIWLKRGPTVFVSLGTILYMTEDEAAEMAGAIQQLLETVDKLKPTKIAGISGELQVLWKLKNFKKDRSKHEYGTGPGTKIYGILQRALDSDRLRISDWVKPEPGAILQTGTVVCSVNHGGANSFNDALTSGIPQVSLPCWLDCYDFGVRTEILGIGRWGNKKAMPRCSAQELGPILVDLVVGPKADAMRSRVKELAALCAERPGAVVAAGLIVKEVEARKGKGEMSLNSDIRVS